MSLRAGELALRFARPANFFRGRLANLRVNKLTSVARSILHPPLEDALPYAFPSEIIPLPFFHSPTFLRKFDRISGEDRGRYENFSLRSFSSDTQ